MRLSYFPIISEEARRDPSSTLGGRGYDRGYGRGSGLGRGRDRGRDRNRVSWSLHDSESEPSHLNM